MPLQRGGHRRVALYRGIRSAERRKKRRRADGADAILVRVLRPRSAATHSPQSSMHATVPPPGARAAA
eukprot:29717-Chlamydomonas_euryale.AAC.2